MSAKKFVRHTTYVRQRARSGMWAWKCGGCQLGGLYESEIDAHEAARSHEEAVDPWQKS